MEKKDRYNPAVDVIRVIAILAVIAIHTSTRILETSKFDIQGFTLTFFINQATRFAVPLFFMISGFVLELNYSFHQNYLTYLQKRFTRIFLPYLFWSFLYFFFVHTQHNISFFQTLLTGKASYQLYFIPTLLILYITFPFIHMIYRFIANKFVLIVLGIIQLSLLAYTYYIKPLPFFYPLNIALLNFYIFILGMVASHHKRILEKIGRWKILFGILFVVLAGIIFFEGRIFYLNTHNHLYFYNQWRPSTLIYSIVVGCLLYAFFNKKTNAKIIKMLSRLSFFVFFVHIIVLEYFWSLVGKNIFSNMNDALLNLLFFFCVTVISYGVAYLAHKIPYLPKLSG
ncbi:MAG: acyltransferase [bacterium]|nr:acyltransferase [bacterium]